MRSGWSSASPRTRSSSSISIASISAAAPTGSKPRRGAISASRRAASRLPQAALLAGLLKAPSRYSPRRSVELASARVDEVLENMVQAGYLSAERGRIASQQPLELSRHRRRDRLSLSGRLGGRAAAGVRRRARRRSDRRDDHRCRLQRGAQQALRRDARQRGRRARRRRRGAWWCSIRIGGVKALVGGRVLCDEPVRPRASKSLRQPGSAFKPFVYLAALESGYTPDSVAYDGPITVAGWSPKNHTGTYRGEVTLRDAWRSRSIPSR